ncbi:phosphatase 6 regulatory subunit 1-like protein fmt isoform X3 [Rhodnius prolixus]|uniref:Putative serine/threonine-protein phosphatase 6 regulatory subunit 3-like isoform x3 n=1 Tax=Rhodnius neglectus TaxID=72488 RepID=A0A0P4W1U7_9HEMI
MFWKYNHQSSPQIDTVLVKEDLTLNEVLDQENLLQELKSQNNKLVEFIIRSDILNQLVSLVTEEPSEELEEHERYRLPNLACEVLTTDIPRLNERLTDKEILTKLFSFLENEPPLNPLLASFFSRTLSMLICRKTDQNWYSYQFTCLQVLEFLKSRENSLLLLLQHLGTSAIMDLTLKLITQVEGDEMQNNLFTWLENEAFISNIVALFHPKIDADRHYNASQLLCDTIKKSREIIASLKEQNNTPTTSSDTMLNIIQSPTMIRKLLGYMLDEGEVTESSITGGISVLLTLLEPLPTENGNRRGPYKDDAGSGEPVVSENPALPSIVSSITQYLPKLHNLLINPPKKGPVHLACGTIEPPLGNTRLTVIKLISALIATNTQEVNDILDQLNTVQVLLDLFFHYTWNNFLHSQVDKCLAFALNTPNLEATEKNPLISNIFIKCRLLQRILEAWEDNETEQVKEGGKRRGYMGHLTNIANSVVRQTDGCLGDFLTQHIDEDTLISWQHYVESTLKPTNELHSRVLGGKHPALSDNKNDDDDANYKEVSFPEDATLQTNYPNFQTITDNLIEYFDRDDPTMSQEDGESGRRIDTLIEAYFERDDSTVSQEENERRAEIFKKMCFRKDFTDINSEEEVWAELPSSPLGHDDASTSSDEEEKIVIETTATDSDTWGFTLDAAVVNQVNPWLQVDSADSPANDGWADFSSADIEQQFQAVQLSVPQHVCDPSTVQDVSSFENDSNGTKISRIEAKVEEVDKKSDNNANLNRLISDDREADEELIDNFRFLSKGMLSENCDIPKQIEKREIPISGNSSVSESEENKMHETPRDPV